ncbi:MAG: hypothetical protein KC656_18255, partial [Myxococcales bacterium]|nr:hypothetical protein [Myxococcales bacterium]
MLAVQLEERFREALSDLHGTGSVVDDRDASIRFAVEFAGLLSRIVPEDSPADAVARMGSSILARTDLSEEEVQLLIGLAMRPEHRSPIDEDALRAFGGRFGTGAEQALRAAVAEEIDLAGFAERYGEAEGLLLLDALFGICA